MRKLFTMLVLFILTLSSSFATTWLSVTLNEDDILEANIFYINWIFHEFISKYTTSLVDDDSFNRIFSSATSNNSINLSNMQSI